METARINDDDLIPMYLPKSFKLKYNQKLLGVYQVNYDHFFYFLVGSLFNIKNDVHACHVEIC